MPCDDTLNATWCIDRKCIMCTCKYENVYMFMIVYMSIGLTLFSYMTAHMYIIFIIVKRTVFIGAMYDPEGHAWTKIYRRFTNV